MTKKEDRTVVFLLIIYYLVMVILAFVAKGTGDDGDSVLHFLYAKYAFAHPENFLNQWAKPAYVLLAAPFAQFGFIGIEIFNITVFTVAIYFSYRSAVLLRISNAWFVVIAMSSAPMCIHLLLSGLTEPLFALALVMVIFLSLKRKLVAAALLVSFLPFFRSEGLIIICIFFLYLLSVKKWKLIPLLITGHVLYSIAGYFYYGDFLWVFTKLSYATLHSVYGDGSPLVFVKGMVEYLGWLLLILFSVGVFAGSIWFAVLFFGRKKEFPHEEFWLVFGSFFSVWIAHMIFWSFGIFNSFGLLRVLVEIVPCAAIICTIGFSTLIERIKISRTKQVVAALISFGVMMVPFFELQWDRDFNFSPAQRAINKAAAKFADELKPPVIYYTAPYISIAFHSDYFDSTKHRLTDKFFRDKKIPEQSILIWDSYAASESRVALGNLMVDERLTLLDTFKTKDLEGNENTVAVFQYHPYDSLEPIASDTLYVNHFDGGNFAGRDSSVAFSGKYSSMVNEQNQFSPGMSLSITQSGIELPATLRISAKFLTHSFSSDLYKHTIIVVALDHVDKNYFWQGFDATNLITERNKWTSVSYKISIPEAISTNDALKVYVWNTNATPTYVDDLVVEHIVRK